jgi:hypothetical protein
VEGLKDWLDSPTRALILVFGTSFMEASTFNGETIDVHVSLSKQEAAGPPPTPPAAVRYRDPADGQFKPLSQIGARGYPAPPAEHVFSIDEPTGADRKQFWISTPVKYGPDRTTQQYPVPLTGTPAQGDPGAGVTHRGTARTENGSIIVTQPAGTFTTSTGCAFTTTFQFPGTADPLDVRPEEAVRATFRVRMTLAGYASNAGVTQPVFSAGTMSIAGGTPFNIAGYLSWNADGVQNFAPVVSDRAQIDALVAGCEIAVFLSLSATMFMPTTATFPELTLTVDPMTVEYTSIPPMMAVLKELVNDVYQPVSYPPV